MRKRVQSNRTTARLVRGARGGDAEAFKALFGRISVRLLLGIQLRLAEAGKETIEPVDILRNTYRIGYRAFRRHAYQDAGTFLYWLRGIADRQIADRAGKRASDDAAENEAGVLTTESSRRSSTDTPLLEA